MNETPWYRDWTTFDELYYIQHMGMLIGTPKEKLRLLLKNYIKTALKRQRWGKIDKNAVIGAAYIRLEQLK